MKTSEIFNFFTEIGIIAQLSQTQFERLMPSGMTIAQFTVLNHCVRVGDGKSPARLAHAFQVTKGTMTSTLHRLEQKGLVAIHPDPADGRSKIVRITETGRPGPSASAPCPRRAIWRRCFPGLQPCAPFSTRIGTDRV